MISHSAPLLDTSQKVFEFFRPRVAPLQEEVWVAALNSQLLLIDHALIFRGTVDHCSIHPRDIFRFLLLNNATSFVLVHNHPSGSSTPSPQDLKMTMRIAQSAKILQIIFIDHVIVCEQNYFSFADHGFGSQKRKTQRKAPP